MDNNLEFKISYYHGVTVEILESSIDDSYEVLFIDNKTNKLHHHAVLKPGFWTKPNSKYYIEWKIVILKNNVGIIHEEVLNLKDKEVLITIDNKPLGDNIAWIPYALEFQRKHDCKVTLQSSISDLFETSYPELNFVKWGTYNMNDSKFYATYKIIYGIQEDESKILFNKLNKTKSNFIDGLNGWDKTESPYHPHLIPLQEYGARVLGLDFKEIRPNIKNISNDRPIEKKYVCISEFASGPFKEWKNQVGWEKLVQMIKSHGYEVVSISKEKTNLKNVIKRNGNYSLEDRSWYLKHCDFFIGVSSGLSWLAWATGTKVVLISGITIKYNEFSEDCVRITNESVCNGCWNSPKHCNKFVTFNYNWCPEGKKFECSRTISPKMVMDKILENKLIR